MLASRLVTQRYATKEQMRRARELAGLTQQAVADKLHVDLRTVQRWEAGEVPCRRVYLDRLRELQTSSR